MPPNPRVARAFKAMKDIGISEDKVKPVLKNLLKLYDKNWELIEEENYRVLADAIFDNEEVQAAEEKKKFENTEAAEEKKKFENTEAAEEKKKFENTEAAEEKKKFENTERGHDSEEEAQEHEEPERPLKRLRLKYQEGQTSQSRDNSSSRLAGTPLVKPKDEPVELPEVQIENTSQSMVGTGHPNNGDMRTESENLSRQSLDRNKGKQPVSPKTLMIQERSDPSEPVSADKSRLNVPRRTESDAPHPMHLRNKGKETLSHQIASGGKNLDSERSYHAVRIQEPRAECGIMSSSKQKNTGNQDLIKPKEEPVTDDVLQFEAPLAVIHPETSNKEESSKENNSITERDCEEPLALKSVAGKHTSNGVPDSSSGTEANTDLAKVPDESFSQLQIASSPLGEVKISFTCKVCPGGPNFHLPRLDEVIKTVEDRCLRSYKVLPPNFSVMKLMKDMCQCFVELGSGSCNESKETRQVSPSIELLGKFSSAEPFVAGDAPSNTVNGLLSTQSEAEVGLPQISQFPPPCNGVDEGRKPDKSACHGNGGVHEESEQDGLDDSNSKSLVIVRQHQLTSDLIRSLHDVSDISKGQERVTISLVNEINSLSPPSFHYIPQNAVFQDAYMIFSLARIGDDNCCSNCSGDCFSLTIPCACAHETGGEFAYTSEGLVKEEFLKECISMNRDPEKHCQFFCKECPLERSKNEDIIEPCKGHLVRKFIKECWWKCGCNKQCGNRVVQRGITRNLQVFMTERKGWGLRTLEDLPKGAFICEYVGETLTNAELFDRVSKSPKGAEHSYPVLLDADWVTEGVLKDEEALCLDATYYGNVARFINHRCFDSTLVEIPVEVETPDHHYYHLAFFTTRKVKAMEELTWDYGIDFDDLDHPVEAFRCQCGSRYCRNIKRTTRSRSSRS